MLLVFPIKGYLTELAERREVYRKFLKEICDRFATSKGMDALYPVVVEDIPRYELIMQTPKGKERREPLPEDANQFLLGVELWLQNGGPTPKLPKEPVYPDIRHEYVAKHESLLNGQHL